MDLAPLLQELESLQTHEDNVHWVESLVWRFDRRKVHQQQ